MLTEKFTTPNGLVLRVHDKDTCQGEFCVIHKPMDTYPRESLWWRSDRGIFEVICDHGVGHPLPSRFYTGISRGKTGRTSTVAALTVAAPRGSTMASSGHCLCRDHENCQYKPCTCACHSGKMDP